ncbi:MAG: phosphotransferase family protein [Candidatus Binataceae bacterium]
MQIDSESKPAASATGDAELSRRLLEYLRATLQQPDLAYSEEPRRLIGGFDAAIFAFQLNRAPGAYSGPLVLRLVGASNDLDRVRIEATVQNALAEMGYPAPRVFRTETEVAILGGAFVLMERISGRTLARGFEGLGRGRGPRDLIRILTRVPGMLREIRTMMIDAQYRLHQLPVEPLVRAFEQQGLPIERLTLDGRLKSLRELVEQAALAGLRPGVTWLDSYRVSESGHPVICHCDFQPFNILTEGGRGTGVLDWGNVTLGDPAMDLGASTANMMAIPIEVPGPLRWLFRRLLNMVARQYYRGYCRLNPLDDRAVRYYQVFRCMMQLVWIADGISNSRPPRGAFDSPAGISALIAQIRKLTGLQLHFDLRRCSGEQIGTRR